MKDHGCSQKWKICTQIFGDGKTTTTTKQVRDYRQTLRHLLCVPCLPPTWILKSTKTHWLPINLLGQLGKCPSQGHKSPGSQGLRPLQTTHQDRLTHMFSGPLNDGRNRAQGYRAKPPNLNHGIYRALFVEQSSPATRPHSPGIPLIRRPTGTCMKYGCETRI